MRTPRLFPRQLLFSLFLALGLLFVKAEAFPLNDGHIHYNQDIWSRLSPGHALKLLSANGIERAIVFSTPTEGTEQLYDLAPQRVIPFVRPYRNDRDRFTYFNDDSIIPYLKEKIELGIFRGIGEMHLFKENKQTPVVRQIMQLAADHQLAVSAHADHETILTLLQLQPSVHLIWAHCGMDHPFADVKKVLEQHENLYCELSFRYGMFDENFQLRPEWKTLLEKSPEKFVLGMDTYVPRRWAALPEQVEVAREWLMQLTEETRNKIARENINNWFPNNIR